MSELQYQRGRDNIVALGTDWLNGTLTQGYGHTGFESFHDGADIVLADSAYWGGHPPVHAPMSGVVTAVQTDAGGYGKHVTIRNATGWEWMVGHLNDFYQIQRPGGPPDPNYAIKVGDRVYAGDVIGHEDSTGWSTGPHVHYRLHDPAGQSVDPTLGSGPILRDDYGARTNIIYAAFHDLGLGAGDNRGNQQKWAQAPPPPMYTDAPIAYAGGRLAPNPGNNNGQPIPVPVGQPPPTQTCIVGSQAPQNADGSCPTGYQLQMGSDPQHLICVCTSNNGGLPIPSLPGIGDIGQSIQQGILTIGVVLVGIVFIAAGLIALTHEGPVNAVTQPIISGTKGAIDAGKKVAGATAVAA